jgi:hypothetical protein
MRRRPDSGGGDIGGRWNSVGRGRRGRVPEGASIAGFAPAAALRWGFGGGAAWRRRKFLGRFPSRASGEMTRAAAGAQSIPSRIVQNAPRPKLFTATHDLERLLEEFFCLRHSKQAIKHGGDISRLLQILLLAPSTILVSLIIV